MLLNSRKCSLCINSDLKSVTLQTHITCKMDDDHPTKYDDLSLTTLHVE